MPQKFTSDSPSMQEILQYKNPTQKTTRICLKPDLINELNDLYAVKINKPPQTKSLGDVPVENQLQETIDKLEAQIEEYTVTFKFEGMGRKKFDELITDHPPTEEQEEAFKKETGGGEPLGWNTDTFPIALVARCCIDPKIEMDQARRMFDDWDGPDLTDLFMTALAANQSKVTAPFFKSGIEEIISSDSRLITALSEESPTPSS